jgi:hypothetical protein
MGTQKDRSLASILKLGIDVGWGLAWLALAGVALACLLYAAAMASGGAMRSPFLHAVADRESWQAIAPGLAVGVIYAAGLVVIFAQLRRIFATLVEGDPFVPENASRLRKIAWAVIGLELARYAIQIATAWIVTAFGQPASGSLEIDFRPSLAAWAAALVLFVLAQVFREGARLRQQDQLTI